MIFKTIWKKINGTKLMTGAGLMVAGIALSNIPFGQVAAPYFIYSGLGVWGVGQAHKVIKYKNKQKE